MDPHRNVYFYYAGQRHAGSDRDRQVEDNTTKALINTLELSARQDGSRHLLVPFLNWVGVNPGGDTEAIPFALQRTRIPATAIRKARRRVLLGIAPRLPGEVSDTKNDNGGARPDAWIWGSGLVLCIENKVVGTFDRKQLDRHHKLLGPGAKENLITWADVYGFFEDWLGAARKDKHLVTRTLVAEFIAYLDIIAYRQGIAMGTFKGFKQEHFDAFVIEDSATDEDNRKAVQHQLGLFVEAVRDGLPKELSDFAEPHHGNIRKGDRHAWITLSRTDTPVHEPHFSFSIGPEEVAIRLLMEGKQPSLAAMKSIDLDPGGFLTVLRRLGKKADPGYAAELWHRWQVRVRQYRSAPVCRFHVKYATKTDVEYLLEKMRAIRSDQSQQKSGGLFELHITRSFPRDDQRVRGKGLIKLAVDSVGRLARVARTIS